MDPLTKTVPHWYHQAPTLLSVSLQPQQKYRRRMESMGGMWGQLPIVTVYNTHISPPPERIVSHGWLNLTQQVLISATVIYKLNHCGCKQLNSFPAKSIPCVSP